MTTAETQYKLILLEESMKRVAFNLTYNKHDAEDLIQETFYKVFKNCDKYENGTNFRAWIFTILRNTFINQYRRSKNFPSSRFDNTEIEKYHMNQSGYFDSHNPYSVYIKKELEEQLELLNDKIKLPLKMHLEGFKYTEISEILDLKIGTVKSRIFFARKKLIKQLK